MGADTRSPEQRRQDELNLAHVRRRIATERATTWTHEQRKAYRAGEVAGLAGFAVRGVAGMEIHEAGCDAAYRLGIMAEWQQGYSEGKATRDRNLRRR